MPKQNVPTLQQIQEIRAYYREHRNHAQSMSRFDLTPAQEYAINKLGNEFCLTDKEILAGLKVLNNDDFIPESVAYAMLNDEQFVAFLNRRDNNYGYIPIHQADQVQ